MLNQDVCFYDFKMSQIQENPTHNDLINTPVNDLYHIV